MSEFLSVRKWDDYNHYKSGTRKMVWFKTHPEIMDKRKNPDMVALPIPARLLAIAMLCLAARYDNAIPNDAHWIGVEISMPTSTVKRSLADLMAINFVIPLDSDLASNGATPKSKEREEEPPSVEPNGSTSVGPQKVVEWFVDESRSANREPPRSVVGQVATQVRQLLDDGFSAEQVQGGLRILIDKGKHPSILPSLVYEAQAAPKRKLLPRFGRGVTTEDTGRSLQSELNQEFKRKELDA